MAITTKKTAKAPKMANVIKTTDQLRQELIQKQADLVGYRRGHKQGELANPRVIGTTRKEIARIHTAICINDKENK